MGTEDRRMGSHEPPEDHRRTTEDSRRMGSHEPPEDHRRTPEDSRRTAEKVGQPKDNSQLASEDQ